MNGWMDGWMEEEAETKLKLKLSLGWVWACWIRSNLLTAPIVESTWKVKRREEWLSNSHVTSMPLIGRIHPEEQKHPPFQSSFLGIDSSPGIRRREESIALSRSSEVEKQEWSRKEQELWNLTHLRTNRNLANYLDDFGQVVWSHWNSGSSSINRKS